MKKHKSNITNHHNNSSTKVRLNRAKGHLEAVVNMIETERSCGEIIQQLSAVISALSSARNKLIQDHLKNCIKPALKPGYEKLVDEIELVIERGIKTK